MRMSDIMAAAGLGSWAELGLVVSFITFVTIVIYVVVRRGTSWTHASRLPLDDDPAEGGHSR